MDANTTVENLISVFLEANLEHFETLMKSTESTIRSNHIQIIQFLKDNGCDPELTKKLETELKIGDVKPPKKNFKKWVRDTFLKIW